MLLQRTTALCTRMVHSTGASALALRVFLSHGWGMDGGLDGAPCSKIREAGDACVVRQSPAPLDSPPNERLISLCFRSDSDTPNAAGPLSSLLRERSSLHCRLLSAPGV